MADDPLSAALAEIRDFLEEARIMLPPSQTQGRAGAAWRLLAAFEILLKAHARYTTTELYTELLTALRGDSDGALRDPAARLLD